MIRDDQKAVSIEQLSGCSFVEAFHMCVLKDPQVIAASKRIENPERYEPVFREGLMPGPVITYRWPIEMTAKGLAYDFVRPAGFLSSDPQERASDEIRHVAELIVDCWQQLRRRLIDGDLVAQGTFARTGLVQPIDPMQWRRTNYFVDLQNGDLLGEENGKLVALWTGLMLRTGRQTQAVSDAYQAENAFRASSPNSTFHGEPTSYNNVRPNTLVHRRRSPVASEVAKAVKACGIADLPGSRSWKEVAALVGPFMPKEPNSDNELQALIKALQRHFKKQKDQN